MPTFDSDDFMRDLKINVMRDIDAYMGGTFEDYQRQIMKMMGRDLDAEEAQAKVDSAVEVVANVLASSEELDPDQDAVAVVKALGLAEISIGVAELERKLERAKRQISSLKEEVRLLRGSVPENNVRRGPVASVIITDEAGNSFDAGGWDGNVFSGGGVRGGGVLYDKGPVVPIGDPPKITQEMAANAIKGARKKRPPYVDQKRRVKVDEYGVEHPY